jgi:glycosyltransferase involved in cell wall biosynthesis
MHRPTAAAGASAHAPATGDCTVVLQFGPEIGTHGGMASVLESYARLPLSRFRFEFVPTWTPDAFAWGARPLAGAVRRLLQADPSTTIAHVHLSKGGSFVREGLLVALARRRGIPVVVSLHGGQMLEFGESHPRLVGRVLSAADAVIALGATTEELARRYASPGTRIVVVANPIELPADVRPAGDLAPVALFAGEVGRLKGADVLIDAWPRVQAACPSARLIVAGPPADVEPVPLQNVEWTGALSRAEVGALLVQSRVAVLPSRFEVMPMFLLEAMAAARAVVATSVGEVPSLVGDAGLVVPPGDADALAEALVAVLNDPTEATRRGTELRQRAEEQFSPARVAAELEAVYESVAPGRRTTGEHAADHSSTDITVTVCAFNAAATIDGALASIAGQTKAPGAVIVIDDGSSDNTAALAQAWRDQLPIEVVTLDANVGVGEARRQAVAHTTTPLVAILDADDVMLPDHLETMLDVYRHTPGVVTAHALHWVPGQGIAPANEATRFVPPPDAQLRRLLDHDFLSTTTLFARSDYDRAGGFRAIPAAEDWDLWLRMVRNGVQVSRAGHPTVLYRIGTSSLSYGYSTTTSDAYVLDLAVREAVTDDERRWARQSLRRVQANGALAKAFDYACDAQNGPARAAAVGALRYGTTRVRVRAAVVALAPHVAARMHEERTADLSRWID